jgi:hypothetical protein
VRTMDVRYRGIDGEFGAPATHCLRKAEEDIDSLAEDGRLKFTSVLARSVLSSPQRGAPPPALLAPR